MLMVQAWVGGMATQGGDGIAKVRTGPQHGIHKGAEGMLVGFGGNFGGLEFDEMFIGKG
jgi:hypothetical protein